MSYLEILQVHVFVCVCVLQSRVPPRLAILQQCGAIRECCGPPGRVPEV